MESREPSGLFPSEPPRPTLREVHAVRPAAVLAGAGVAAGWLLAWGLLATSTHSYLWLTLAASLTAWACAAILAYQGDRGVAAGVAMATSVGLAAGTVVLIEQWVVSGWPLW